jgi:hypothetical protein
VVCWVSVGVAPLIAVQISVSCARGGTAKVRPKAEIGPAVSRRRACRRVCSLLWGRPLLVDVEQVERVGAVFVGGAAVGACGLKAGVAEELGDGDQVGASAD